MDRSSAVEASALVWGVDATYIGTGSGERPAGAAEDAMAWPRLRNAPITEALIDIRADVSSATSLTTLTAFHDLVRDRYPQLEERRLDQIEVRLDPAGTQVSSTGAATGYLLRALSGEKAVQARLDGFTFNKLRPYESWELFRDEAR